MAWVIDTAHSAVDFSVKHMMISTVRGHFGKFSGTLNFDENNLAGATVEGTIEAASIDTNEPNRDGHLRSADFFDAEKYPTLSFKSTKVVATGTGSFDVYGNLTIKDTTKEFVFHVTDEGKAVDPFAKIQKHAFSAEGKLNRKDFGLNWNVALEAGGWLVGEEVKLHVELELNNVVEGATAAHA
jgi:polyisoprenoid-binding protein YceI